MDPARLARALETLVGPMLAGDLTREFLTIRQDAATKTLGRGSPGKFIETFVQALQFMASGSFDVAPSVDQYLDQKVLQTSLPDDLRVCAARIARAVYTLRNKRNISHKNSVDPNSFDLAFIHQSVAWIMAELLRQADKITMEEAGALIELVQAPVGTLVEEIAGARLVHAATTIEGELLLLLHSHYPEYVAANSILLSLVGRSSGAVRNQLGAMRKVKMIVGDAKAGYRLTSAGHAAAIEEIKKHIS